MIRGLYISASGMLAGQTRLDTVAHNTANLNTTGYRRQEAAFAPCLETAVLRHGARLEAIGRAGLGVTPVALVTDLSGGPVDHTSRSADLALEGDGFFTVERGGEFLYTRSGSFTVDAGGRLVSRSGDPVMGEQGVLEVGDPNFTVTGDGRVLSAAGEELDRLRLAAFADGERLTRTADGYLAAGEGQTVPVRHARVFQGFLEGANTNLAEEMVELTVAARTYAANQRMLRTHDTLLEKAINQVGVLR